MPHEPTDKSVEAVNRGMNAPEDGDARRIKSAARTAMTPASGAAANHALAGAQISADEPMSAHGETADALKRAAENDGRV